ncbi:hypothetical protein NQ317_001199 [Molorchus minor]|uniref:Choline transporter-like protein n=1 Tax=Molorchus minor TaxID=1323400 RepID=A0ABQ9JFT0_9CUCU|nr:hypothetical protein NQ317_001199 [Molorchus minor]
MGSKRDRVTPTEGAGQSESIEKFKDNVRRTTDICFLMSFVIFFIALVCFLGYCIYYGDTLRVINGYDNCGHVCGTPDVLRRDMNCYKRGQFPTGPYHIVLRSSANEIDRVCVANCSEYEGYREFFTRCIPQRSTAAVDSFFSKTGLTNLFDEVSEDFQLYWREFVYLCLIAFGFSILILVLFRFLVGLVVWIVLVAVVLICIAGTIFLWVLWHRSKLSNGTTLPDAVSISDSGNTTFFLAMSIVASIVTVSVILILIVMRKRIQLVVQLFKESGKAITAMPALLFQPIVTFVTLAGAVSVWLYFSLWIESSGVLTREPSNVYYYEKDVWMKLTRWYNLFSMFWSSQFIIGCQHMVIAGAVSKWYFTRDKKKLNSPVVNSAYNLARYHLGSVALGSFLIAIVQFARVLLKLLEKSLKGRKGKCAECTFKCCQCCLYCFEKILKYLSRNAYIEVAIHGYSFCRAGKQAFKLLTSNVLRVAAINSVGDFVLFLGKVTVVAATVLIGINMLQDKPGVHHIWVPVTIAALFAYFVAHCFLTVYEMTIDTIFLCFCEDCEMNDGISRPYYMSRGLMEFVENSNKALELDVSKRKGNAWQSDQSCDQAV